MCNLDDQVQREGRDTAERGCCTGLATDRPNKHLRLTPGSQPTVVSAVGCLPLAMYNTHAFCASIHTSTAAFLWILDGPDESTSTALLLHYTVPMCCCCYCLLLDVQVLSVMQALGDSSPLPASGAAAPTSPSSQAKTHSTLQHPIPSRGSCSEHNTAQHKWTTHGGCSNLGHGNIVQSSPLFPSCQHIARCSSLGAFEPHAGPFTSASIHTYKNPSRPTPISAVCCPLVPCAAHTYHLVLFLLDAPLKLPALASTRCHHVSQDEVQIPSME